MHILYTMYIPVVQNSNYFRCKSEANDINIIETNILTFFLIAETEVVDEFGMYLAHCYIY